MRHPNGKAVARRAYRARHDARFDTGAARRGDARLLGRGSPSDGQPAQTPRHQCGGGAYRVPGVRHGPRNRSELQTVRGPLRPRRAQFPANRRRRSIVGRARRQARKPRGTKDSVRVVRAGACRRVRPGARAEDRETGKGCRIDALSRGRPCRRAHRANGARAKRSPRRGRANRGRNGARTRCAGASDAHAMDVTLTWAAPTSGGP